MIPEEKIIYKFLKYGIEVLEEQIMEDMKNPQNLDDMLEQRERLSLIDKLKKQLKELKNG